MIFTPSDVSSLSQSLQRWEIAEYIFEGLVIVACAGELVAHLGRKCLTRARRDRIGLLSTILLVAALSMELLCLVKTNELSGRLIGSLSDKAEAADSKAQSAVDKSSLAEKKADAAEKQADSLTSRMEEASRKLSKLEEGLLIQGPRWRLLKNGETAFIQALKPFAPQKVTVMACLKDDTEQFALEQVLLDLFRKAGWPNPGYMTWDNCPHMLTGGNEIYFTSTSGFVFDSWARGSSCRTSPDLSGEEAAAVALCSVLHKLKINTSAFAERPVQDGAMKARAFFGQGLPGSPGELAEQDPTTIFVFVGPK